MTDGLARVDSDCDVTREEEFIRMLRDQTDRIDRIENARYRESVPNPIVATTDRSASTESVSVESQPAASMQFGDPFAISEFPMPAAVEPPDTTPPTAPSGLAADATTDTTATISWTAASDNVDVDYYLVLWAKLPAPTGVMASDTTADSTDLSWDAVPDADHYIVTYTPQ